MHAQGFPLWWTAMIVSCLVTARSSVPALAQSAGQPSTGQVAIAGVIAAGSTVELVKDGFGNLDGPVAGPNGSFYFSDVGVGQTYRISPNGTIELVNDFNNSSTSLGFDAKGRLIALEGITGRVVAIDAHNQVTVLVDKPPTGDRYAPNDLIIDSQGGVYFTDPASRSQGGDTRASRVLYVAPGRPPVLITSAIDRPTGITLTLDGKMLLIADSDSGNIMAMDVQPDGTAVNLRPWLRLKNMPAGRTGTPEGLAIDSEGRLYVATAFGVHVYSRMGEFLGSITVPRLPSNVAFGGPDRKTLYITARSALYRIRTLSAGPSGRGK